MATIKTPAGVKTGSNKSRDKNSNRSLQQVNKELQQVTSVLSGYKKLGLFSKDELKNLFTRVANLQIKAVAKRLGVEETLNRGVLPVLLAGRPLAAGDRHPDYTGWLTADEIGKPFNLSYDKITKFTKQLMENEGHDSRANKEISDQVTNFGFPAPDKYAYLTHMNKDGSCIAIWAAGKDGATNWRNYWSPDAVVKLHDLIKDGGFSVLPATTGNGTPATA